MKERRLRIKELREAKGLTQDYVARMAGVARSTFALWETGRRKPTFDNLIALSRVFGCKFDELFEEEL